MHWLLVTNSKNATAWYWFFNCFHKAEFTSEEAAEALADFVKNVLTGKHSERTVKQEIPMILRMCHPTTHQTPIEDSLDMPLSSLNLVTAVENSPIYRSFSSEQTNLPIGIIGYAVNEVFNNRQVKALPIHDLMHGQKYGIALGSVFRLTESALLAKLENLVKAYPDIFLINETAGIYQLYRTDNRLSSLAFLHDHYNPKQP